MKGIKNQILVVLLTSLVFNNNLLAQNTANPDDISGDVQLNTITTAVPFLMISPDSRSGGMGDVGASTSPDANSIHWNPAKLAFIDGNGGVSLTYSPWLSSLVGDISLSYLSGYYRINKQSTIGSSLRYFSLGDITFTDVNGQTIGNFTPNEFAIDVAYSLKLSRQFSFGTALRYITSNLTAGITVDGSDTKPGRSVAADVAGYYVNDEIEVGGYDAIITAGLNISNIGAKMAYTNNDETDFIPTNLRLGSSLTLDFDDYNSMTFTLEANKLLVPTPPIYLTDTTGTVVRDPNGDAVIVAGKDPNVSPVSGIFASFSDAPGVIESVDEDGSNAVIENGSVFREEMSEISYSVGVEYWYDKQFAVRMGYFYENPNKGNRQYFTAGVGLKLTVFALDVSYLAGNVQQNPLANTWRFSLKFNFDDFNSQNNEQ